MFIISWVDGEEQSHVMHDDDTRNGVFYRNWKTFSKLELWAAAGGANQIF